MMGNESSIIIDPTRASGLSGKRWRPTPYIGRMVQHVFPKGFQRVRYYGVQATKTFAKLKGLIQKALAKVKGIVKGAIKIIAPMAYRQRY